MFRDIPSDLLFCKYDMFRAIESQKQALTRGAEEIDERRLRAESIDVLAEAIAKKFQIEVPQLIEEEITVSRPTEVDIQLSRSQQFEYGWDDDTGRKVKGTAVTFSIPFKGDALMFSVRPSSFSLNPPRADVSGAILTLTISGVTLDQAAVKSKFEDFLRTVKENLACQTRDVASFNDSAKAVAFGALQTRQQRLQKGDDLVSGLGYKIK